MSLETDALDKAKQFITYDADILGKIEASVYPAKQELKVLIGKKEYCRLYNSAQNSSITKVEDGGFGFSKVFVNPYSILEFDDVVITGTTDYDGIYDITTASKEESYFYIEKPFTVTKTGNVNNEIFEMYKTALAWLICYYTTFAVQKIRKDEVLLTSEQFGDGDIKSFGIQDIIRQRDDYLRNAHFLLGRVEIRKA